jgi:hypothetical protein
VNTQAISGLREFSSSVPLSYRFKSCEKTRCDVECVVADVSKDITAYFFIVRKYKINDTALLSRKF